MVFNGDSDDQDICSVADGLINTDDTSFPLKKKAMFANQAVSKIMAAIWKAYGGWKYEDTNQTTLPSSTGTLNANQSVYRLPSDSQNIFGFSYIDNNGNSYPLKPITEEQIKDKGYDVASFMNVAGNPKYYLLFTDTFQIFPAANFTNATGLKILYSRDSLKFASTDTTKQPGFDSQWHEAVATYMAWQQAKAKQKPQQGGRLRNGAFTGLASDWNDYLADIKDHYSKKFRQQFPPRFRNKDAVQEYI